MENHIGYQTLFMEVDLNLPTITDSTVCAPLKKDAHSNEIKYTHYSSFQHKERLLPLMTAVNISGEHYNAPTREGNEPWDYCDQILEEYQLGGKFYSNDENTFDRGHLVRRVDPCWGSQSIANQAELETFRWTNCTTQHKKLNQKGGIWYELEQHVMEHGAKNKIADISVFAGPVLDKNDRAFAIQYSGKDVKIPSVFWKVISWKKTDGKLYAVGFMMSQYEWIKDKLKPGPQRMVEKEEKKEPLEDNYFENLKFGDHKTYQVPIKDIEKATGIKFNWQHVTFPYVKKEYTPVSGKEIKPYRLASLNEAYKSLEKEKQGSATHMKARAILPQKETIVQEKINEMAKNRFMGVRQLELSGITL